MNKDRQIVSELRNFFTESGCGLGTQRIMNVLGTINITERQIASISLNILQYNLLSYVKRFESYETIGGLFREITAQTVELSVTEKIWGLIQQLVSAIADFFSADFDDILTNIIYENKQLKAIMRVAQQLQPAA